MCSMSENTVRAPDSGAGAGGNRLRPDVAMPETFFVPAAGELMKQYATGRSGAREDFCRYLAGCYYEPAEEFREERLFDAMLAAASAIDGELADSVQRLGAAFERQALQDLLVDYTRLFVGPAQPLAMPNASFWLTDDPSQRHAATMAVLGWFEEGGFDVSDEFRELPDHVAAELEFLYLLLFALNQARAAGNAGEAARLATLHGRFVVEHLGVWIERFAASIGAGADTDFYRELASCTRRFLRLEAEPHRLN